LQESGRLTAEADGMKHELLMNFEGLPFRHALSEHYTLIDFPPRGSLPHAGVLAQARIMVTGGRLSREHMDLLPALELICCVGTGFEHIDLVAARERGIMVSYGAGTNAVAVADHAFALLLAIMRDISWYDALTKRGEWRNGPIIRPLPTGKRLGLIGLGAIGEKIARRAEAFDMTIAYHTRRPRPEFHWEFFTSARALAESVDLLIIAAPGGRSTFHMVDAEVLKALGPQGYLVNVGRGSIVDTQALIVALRERVIAGAALDVFENEPEVPSELRALDNVVLTPHTAGFAPEVQRAASALLRENIELFLKDARVLTPIPDFAA
jgi:lactate dehydrogenase-like 2-hydroxyacid dehydrogenase